MQQAEIIMKESSDMSDKEKKFQSRLFLGALLGSIIIFFVIKLFWKDASYSLLLLLLMIGFVLNFIISIIRSKKQRQD